MKKLLFLSFVVLVSLSVSAQVNKYAVGTNAILGGIGLGSDLGSGFTYGSQSPALSLQYERGLWEFGPGVISLGGYIGNKTYTNNYFVTSNPYNYKVSYTTIGARGAYHFTGLDVDNLDLYGGLMLAYEAASLSYNQPGYSGLGGYGSKVDLGIYVGGRYYFSSHIGAFAELGYSVAILNIGLVVKW
jgi:hypothetical protein